MKKVVFIACSIVLLFGTKIQAQTSKEKLSKTDKPMTKETIYQFKVEDLSGDTFDFAGTDFESWAKEIGFKKVTILFLAGESSAVFVKK